MGRKMDTKRMPAFWVIGIAALMITQGVNADTGWIVETTRSAVYGIRHEALLVQGINGFPSVQKGITVSCEEDEGQASVMFAIVSDDPRVDPSFEVDAPSIWGRTPVAGSARTRLTDGIVPAASIVELTNYYNEVQVTSRSYIPGLRTTFLNQNSTAWNVLENLPIALALGTNIGEVEFVLSDDPAVRSVLTRCANSPKPAAFTSEQYEAQLKERRAEEARIAAERRRIAAEEKQRALANRPNSGVEIITSYPPRYPAKLVRDRVGGVVVVRLLVGADGALLRSTIEKSSGNAILDASALEATKRWKFKPAVRGGVDVEGEITVPMTFSPP